MPRIYDQSRFAEFLRERITLCARDNKQKVGSFHVDLSKGIGIPVRTLESWIYPTSTPERIEDEQLFGLIWLLTKAKADQIWIEEILSLTDVVMPKPPTYEWFVALFDKAIIFSSENEKPTTPTPEQIDDLLLNEIDNTKTLLNSKSYEDIARKDLHFRLSQSIIWFQQGQWNLGVKLVNKIVSEAYSLHFIDIYVEALCVLITAPRLSMRNLRMALETYKDINVMELQSFPKYFPVIQIAVKLIQSIMMWSDNRLSEAAKIAREAEDILENTEAVSPRIQSGFLTLLSTIYQSAGQIKNLQRLVSKAENIGDHYTSIHIQISRGLYYWFHGEYKKAKYNLNAALKLTENPYQKTEAMGHIALVYLSLFQLQKALDTTEQHIQLARKIRWKKEAARGEGNRGTTKIYFRSAPLEIYKSARKDLIHDLRLNAHPISYDARISAYVGLSLCHSQLGNHERAYFWAKSVYDHVMQSGEFRVFEPIVLRNLARCQVRVTKTEKRSYLELALEKAKDLEYTLDQAACLLSLSAITDDTHQSKELWNQGAHLLKLMGAEKWLEGYEIGDDPLILMLR